MDRAESFVHLKRKEEAIKDWDSMIEVGNNQSSPHIRMYWAMALAHRGGHARSTAEVKALQAQKLAPENDWYNFPCIYSLSSAAVLDDANLTLTARKELAEHYAARSVELLEKARKLGRFKTGGYVDFLLGDSDFDPVRSRDDYKRLISRLQLDRIIIAWPCI
jgi:hypothetical protein